MAVAEVQVMDEDRVPVSNAEESGTWSGLDKGDLVAVTNTYAVAAFSSAKSKKSGSFIFSVTGLAATGYQFDTDLNIEESDAIDQ